MSKIYTIKNSQISTLSKLLVYDMTFAQARMRDRFFELVNKKATDLETNRMAICKKCAEKDEKGEPIMKDHTFVFPKDTPVFEELANLFNEDCKIDFPPSMYTDIGGIKGLIEMSTVVLSPVDQINSKDIMEAFNTIEDSPESEQPLPEVEPTPTA